jgi:hypothetical protein
VGRAEVDGIVVSFDPKFDDSLKSLFGYATQASFQVEDVPATVSDLGDLAVLLIRQLLDRARAYLSTGGDFDYTERIESAAWSPGGSTFRRRSLSGRRGCATRQRSGGR